MPPRRQKIDRDAKRNLVPSPPPPKRKIPGRNINPETGERMPGYKPSLPVPEISPNDPIWGNKPPDNFIDTPKITPDNEFTQGNRDTWGALAAYMTEIGLDSLLQVDANGNPSGWLYQAVIDGVQTEGELLVRLQETPEFQERFAVIFRQKELAAQGQPVQVMTPQQVLQYEREVTSIMVANGLPDYLYDQPNDFNDLILSGESAVSVGRKIETAFNAYDSAPPEVRRVFSEFYGVSGRSNFASYVLDPDRTLNSIERAQRTAYAFGMGKRFDVELTREMSERIADSSLTTAGIDEGLQQVAAQSGLVQRAFGERGNIDTETAAQVVFEGDSEAATALERRQIQRGAAARVGGGGALLTQEGVVGL